MFTRILQVVVGSVLVAAGFLTYLATRERRGRKTVIAGLEAITQKPWAE